MTIRTPYAGVVLHVCVLLASVLLVLLPTFADAQDVVQRVKSLQIRGNKKIEETAIRGRLTLKVDDPYVPESVRAQVRIIYEMGFFEDVQIETEPVAGGLALIFVVREKPFITELIFDGNENLSDDKLKEKITIRSQTFLDQQQAKESAEKILLAYQEDGYYNSQVTPIVQSLDEERKRLTFYIKEGDRARVKKVIFDGINAVSKKELLKVMATREWILLVSRFTDAGLLKREELANDVERIKEIYLNKGYLNIQVGQPIVELTEDKKWFTVTFPIVEGEPYNVGEIGFRGNTVFEEAELRAGAKIEAGEVFQRAKIRDEITRLTELYGAKGYAFTDVSPSVAPDAQTKTATILFNIKEGDLIRIREIRITGNDKTRDNVIRRELRVNEQEVIDTVSMKRSYQRLTNLNFFETVEILPKQVESDKVDLDVKVKEKSTGSFSIGGGFSTLDKLTAVADITEGNFRGNGQMVRLRGQFGQRRNIFVFSFREPYFQDSLTSLQFDMFNTRTDYTTYTETKSGGTATFGRWFSEFTSGALSLVYENLKIADPIEGANTLVLQQIGTQSTSGFRSSISRDTRDYYVDPRTGSRTAVNFDLGTRVLGGTNNFFKIQLDAAKYTPLFWDTRHMIRGRFGLIDGYGGRPIPLTEQFYVGGISTMRGFVFGRAGPVTPEGTLLGAARQIIINNDFIFPVSAEAKLNGVLFFDYGQGFDLANRIDITNLRKSAGIEARWISPFGPLRVAYGLNLEPRALERRGVFEFSVGSLF